MKPFLGSLFALSLSATSAPAQTLNIPLGPSSGGSPAGGGASSLIVGSTPITGSCTSGYNLYDNSGVVGCQNPNTLGAATATSLAIGGATLGSNALAVTGTVNISALTTVSSVCAGGAGCATYINGNVVVGSGQQLGWANSTNASGGADTFLTRHAAANLQLGNTDAASPVAQTLGVQNVVAGTSNTAGANWTYVGSLSTGSGASGDIIFQTGGTGAGATVQNTAATALTIKGGTQQVNFAQPFQTASSTTGAGTQTFTNSPCAGLTTEQWIQIKINGQSGTWYLPACQ